VKVLAAILFFLNLNNAFCQSIKWSASIVDDKKQPYLKILGADDEGYFVLLSNLSFYTDRDHSFLRSRKYELQYFTDDLVLKWSLPLTFDEKNIADVAIAGNKVVVLMQSFSKANKTLNVYASQIDKSGKYSSPVLLQEIATAKTDEDHKPDLIISHDEHLIGCAYRLMPKNKEEQLYKTIVFDTSLNIIYRKDIAIPISHKRFIPQSFTLTDNGNFFLLGQEFTTDKRVKAPGEIFYELFSYRLNSDAVFSNKIKLENQFLTDVGISADNMNKKIIVSGFYSDKTTYSMAGVFYYSLSEDSLIQTPVVTSAFIPDFLKRFAMEKNPRSKELTNYSIDRVVLRKDGGAAVVAESFYTTTQSYWDYYSQMFVTHYYYHYGNIMALSINPNGSLLWSNVITKDQNSTDDNGYLSSYFSAIINGKILSIYNKYVNNPSSVLMTEMTGTGEQSTKILFNDSENISVIPRAGRQVDANILLLPVLKENKNYLVKLTF
jgi:hypothetical protein